ncbi:protein-glutamine gamma-glutamyltransferase [Bacillus sp. FJAT-49705]|uniref:Protein-glutamine gamma-glutamyltransferase n=1 Tax=Cytobacillus citreus TaxID=2833586 RepID=A0ABS5NN16_9BACI|nr:protein-glutamine gamma-glutamyltransferase [Cytobacillus citreus]MBS4188961.1 protein-glutamine gamma-glutamyltransferase [Cytobacillus citreus]
MIYIEDFGAKPTVNRFHGVQREIFIALEDSPEVHRYHSLHEFLFDLQLRENIILAARKLNESQVAFAPFVTSKFNPRIWKKIRYGYLLDPSVLPSDAIKDIFENGKEYAFECTTAIVIIYYKAVLNSISTSYFNMLFQRLLVWDWNYDKDLGIITKEGRDFIPGDVVYFYNPDYDHPVWSGENTVYLGNGLYFGHGIGIRTEEGMIQELNKLRKKNATRSAYLISQYSRLNTRYLSQFARQTLF